MTADQIQGILRAIVAPMISFAAAKGWLVDNQTGELIITAISAVATAIWSVYAKRQKA